MARDETFEDHLGRIVRCQLYIQDHLDEELTLEELSQVACYSPYHFHRIFRALTGETLQGYIRRLRMERAAGKLRTTQRSVSEISLEVGYETPSAFTKAFKRVMGDSPVAYRGKATLKASIDAQGRPLRALSPKFVSFSETTVLVMRKSDSYQSSPKKAFEALISFADKYRLDSADARYFGIARDNPHISAKEKLRFDACISLSKEISLKDEVGRHVLQGGRYALFEHIGSHDELEMVFDEIFRYWFPTSGKQLADRPCLCEYIRNGTPLAVTRIYVPISEQA